MEVLTRCAAEAWRAELAFALRANRGAVANAFAHAFEVTEKWHAQTPGNDAAREDYLETNFHVFVDYLIEFFARSDVTFKDLFVGEMIKSLHDSSLDDTAARIQAISVSALQRENLRVIVKDKVSAAAWSGLDICLREIERTLTADAPRSQRVLLVGDCLYQDIVPFIVAELLDNGIRLVLEYVTSKNPAALRDNLRMLAAKPFDLVFFSPFSYEFAPEYSRLSKWRQSLMKRGEIRQVVETTWDETRQTLELIGDLFDCPIHVHNSAAVVREESATKRAIKLKASARVRSIAKQQMNQLVASFVDKKNAQSFLHLFVFDENAMVGKLGEQQAGAFFYKTALQHPAVLGRILAQHYQEIIYVNAALAKRKVVVCDLDNTLWDGVIGEGTGVIHFHDRQAALKALKFKGVVLTINSKNNPDNVHWRNGTLCDEDFAYSAISWNPKIQGMKQIQASLNLKMQDYVFIDDREDERQLMQATYPEILCLDATDPLTWQRISLWERTREADPDMDRTLMYRQREERKAFVREDGLSEADRAQLFGSLQLKLTICTAESEDLKRVAELINRTNQFNLEGSRTSLREVREWHESDRHVILLGQTSDRFGDMGTTCIAVAEIQGEDMRLLPFVLSCRVFGYGIEHGVMAQLKQIATQRAATRLVGRYLATPQNAPCKDFLTESDFVENDGTWSTASSNVGKQAPEWLQVSVRQ